MWCVSSLGLAIPPLWCGQLAKLWACDELHNYVYRYLGPPAGYEYACTCGAHVVNIMSFCRAERVCSMRHCNHVMCIYTFLRSLELGSLAVS